MTGREIVIDRERQPLAEGIAAERRGGARGLASHLTAGRSEFRHRLHRVQPAIELDARVVIADETGARRESRRDRVGRPRPSLEVDANERLEARGVTHGPVLRVGLEPKGMREPSRGKEPVGKLQHRDQRRQISHSRWRRSWWAAVR